MIPKSAEARTVTVAFLGFIGLGLTSGLLGLAWPSMQREFNLPLDGVNTLYLVQTAAYTLTSFYIGRLMARLTSGTTLLIGVVSMVVCMFGIASASTWIIVIALSLVFGLGSGLLDAGLNLYMATYHSARQMNWLHACFGIGITVGPLIMTFVLQNMLGWRAGYAIVGALLTSLILLFALTRRLWRNEGLQTAENKPVSRASFAKTLRVPVMWFSMATFTAYIGLELGIGLWAYTILTESRAFPLDVAGHWMSAYWGAFTGGRILFGVIANRFEVDRVLRLSMVGIIIGAVLFWWNPMSAVGIVGLLLIGLTQAPIFPLLMTGTAQRIGAEHAENGISIQMAAVGIGSAILPGLIGTIGKNFGLETMPVVFIVMSLFVFAFHELARVGHAERSMLTSTGD